MPLLKTLARPCRTPIIESCDMTGFEVYRNVEKRVSQIKFDIIRTGKGNALSLNLVTVISYQSSFTIFLG